MSGISKEILRDYSKEQNFTSTNQVLDAMNNIYKDLPHKTLGAEMIHNLNMKIRRKYGWSKGRPVDMDGSKFNQ